MADRTIRTYLRVEVADAKRQLRDFAGEADKASAAFDASGKRIETTAGRLVRSAQVNAAEWRTVGQTFALIGGAGVAALGASAAAAISWESAWAGVLKTVDGTATELERLEGGLRNMARELPASHTEIAAVAEAAGQLGVKVNDVAAFTKVMIDLGETTNLTAEEAATGLARFANVMGTAVGDTDRLGATIVGLGNNFATTEREILEMSQRLAAAGRVVGLHESEVLALATAMSSVGIEAEAGGSAVSRVMIAISKAVDEGGERLDAFARAAGMSSAQFQSAWRDDSISALLGVIGGLNNLTEAGEGAFGMLDELGLKDVRVTNAMLSMASAVDLTRGAVEMANTEWERNTALVEEAQKRYDTTEARIQMAKNAIADAGIEIGGQFLPVIADAADAVAGLAEWFGNLPDPAQRAVAGVGGIASAAALAVGGLAMMVPRLVETAAAFERIGVVSPRVTAAMGRIGGAAAGIAAAAAATFAVGHAVKFLVDSAQGVESVDGSIADLTNRLTTARDSTDGYTLVLGDLADAGQIAAHRFGDLRSSVEAVVNQNWADRFFGGMGLDADGVSEVSKRFQDLGVTLAMIAADELPTAQREFRRLWDDVGGDDEGGAMLLEAMPAYRDALTQMATEAGITATAANLLRLATGDLVLPTQDAAESTDGLTASARNAQAAWEDYLATIGMTADEFAEWTAAAADANASFINMLDAYDQVIAKNIDLATETANATESAKDSWQDYYDGVSVSIDDFIANLEAQVAAQEEWEDNLLSLTDRVSTDMVEYLTGLGQQGSPLVDMLVGAEDDELARIEKLFAEGGVLATEAFANELAKATFGSFPIEADTTPAIAEIDELIAAYHGRVIEMQVKAEPAAAGPPAAPSSTHARVAPPMWGGPAPQVVSQPAQAAMYGNTTSSQGQVMVLREHTVEQTTVHVDKLVAQDVEDFTEQASALRRGAAVAGMRAV